MKKFGKIMALMMVMTMVFAACTQAIPEDTMPAASGEVMDKADDMIKEATMDEDETIGNHAESDDMEKADDMDKADDMAMMNEGVAAPDFSLMDLKGETVALADFAGEKVYVKYWASWCSICVSGLPELDELSGMMNDYKVITIVTPDFLGEKSIEDFKEWYGMKDFENITILLDVKGTYAKEFGIRGLPTSAYIGSDGVLVKVAPGHTSNEEIDAAFTEIY